VRGEALFKMVGTFPRRGVNDGSEGVFHCHLRSAVAERWGNGCGGAVRKSRVKKNGCRREEKASRVKELLTRDLKVKRKCASSTGWVLEGSFHL